MDWPTVTIEAVKILGPALITGFTSYYIAKFQLRTKEIELKGQAEIKARELVFNAYQKKLEDRAKAAEELGRQLGQLVPYVQELEEKSGIVESTKPLIVLLQIISDVCREDFQDLENDLRQAGLHEKHQKKLAHIQRVLSFEVEKLTPQDVATVQNQFLDLTKSYGLIASINNELINKKAMDLFSPLLDGTTTIVKK